MYFSGFPGNGYQFLPLISGTFPRKKNITLPNSANQLPKSGLTKMAAWHSTCNTARLAPTAAIIPKNLRRSRSQRTIQNTTCRAPQNVSHWGRGDSGSIKCPAGSKSGELNCTSFFHSWPFDSPNGGHLTPRKGHLKPSRRSRTEEPGKLCHIYLDKSCMPWNCT